MDLIFRRVLASSVNGAIIFLILVAIYHIVAFVLWFFIPFESHISMEIFSAIFAATYSFCGSIKLGWLPTLGSRIAKTSLQETSVNQRKKPIKLVVRVILSYLMPVIFLFIARSPSILFGNDPSEILFVSSFLAYPIVCAGLMIPVSILVSRGHQGLHDALSGFSVIIANGESGSEQLSFNKLLTRTFIIASFAAIVITVGLMKLYVSFNTHKLLAADGPEKQKIDKIVTGLDSIIPVTPIKLRSYDVTDEFRWWVDMTGDISERLKVNEEIGLKGLDRLDLLGYGFSLKTSNEPIELINFDRETKKTLPVGTNILSVFMFCDVSAFSYPELKQTINRYFSEHVLSNPVSAEAEVIRVKLVRIVKVGVVKIGYFDEVYMTRSNETWRNVEVANLPLIADISTNYIADKSLISARDLE